MLFLPDTILKSLFISALLVCAAHAQAAPAPRLATCAADDPAIAGTADAEGAPLVMASKESSGDATPPHRASAPSATLSNAVISEARLEASRGGTDTASATAQLSATVANNSASNLSSGNNIIDGGSFANMTGLPMVIQNSGANVLIQNATVINLQLR